MASREGSGSLRGGSSADGRQTPEDAGAGDAVSPQRLSIEMQQAAVGRRSLRDRSSSTKGGSNSGSKSSGSGLAKTVTMKQLGWAKDGDAIKKELTRLSDMLATAKMAADKKAWMAKRLSILKQM